MLSSWRWGCSLAVVGCFTCGRVGDGGSTGCDDGEDGTSKDGLTGAGGTGTGGDGASDDTSSIETTGTCPPPCGDACDPVAQDCPGNFKCVPYVSEGSGTWDAYRCVALELDPKQLGEGCVGDFISGHDNCDRGMVCWVLDEPEVSATCHQICGDNNPQITCSDGFSTCIYPIDTSVMLCEPLCEPLTPDCPEGQVCQFDPHSRWISTCGVDAPGGGLQEACVWGQQACDQGLICVDEGFAMECGDGPCCRPLCDVMAAMACGPGEACVQVLDPNTWPGFADVGVCVGQ